MDARKQAQVSGLELRMMANMGASLDISEHLGLLRGLAEHDDVKSIVEIGFRGGVSANALALAGKPLTCIDIEPCTTAAKVMKSLAPHFTFVQGNSLEIDIPSCDLLHIDSLHTYKQLLTELRRHSGRVDQFIAMHDTETFGDRGKDGTTPGLKDAIHEFILDNSDWRTMLHLKNNNGFTILERR
jgi:hypothetical protein